MDRMGLLTMPDYGLNTRDVKYLSMESVVRGRGPNRLKYLDLEGRWLLSGSSIPYISSTFNHLERLNDTNTPMRDLKEEPLDAIGLIRWTKSSMDAEEKPRRAHTLPRRQPLRESQPVFEKKEEEPREPVPYRSAGYGAAHERRKMSVSDRSRSSSPQKSYRIRDPGYASASPSPRPNDFNDPWRPPHRTQGLTSRPSSRTRMHDSDYDPSVIRQSEEKRYSDELRVMTDGKINRTEKRGYNISPRSIGSVGESLSGSELGSPNLRDRTAEDVMLVSYHETTKRMAEPRSYGRVGLRY